jgi:uridylate kinase
MKVYAVSGSIVRSNLEDIQELADAFPEDEQNVVITGAGGLNRYQKALGANNGQKDLVGIKATRLHAKTLAVAMDAYPTVPESLESLQEAVATGKDVVMGGLVPGYSTDAVAATVAELLEAEIYIATNVEGIYTADPEENPEAEVLDEITIEELLEKVSGENTPGTYSIVDESAARIIERSGIEATVFHGTPENISESRDEAGTRILAGSGSS